MKLLVIYSNHHQNNFNFHLLDRLLKKSQFKGHEIVIRDLYKMNFDPVLRTSDFEKISSGNTPDDIRAEQDFIKWADVLLFVYPIWWGGMPAIVKGYIDKVFSWGFAYKSNGNGIVYPMLTDKKAVIINTLGQSFEEYEQGMFQAMNRVNSEGIFGFCGVEVLHQLYFASINTSSDAVKEKYLFEAAEFVANLKVPAAISQ